MPGQPILGDTADKLRPDGVADGEEKHQEDGRLEGLRDRDPNLADQDTGQQGRRDRSQANAFVGELAKVIPDAKREEDGDLRVLAQSFKKPVNHILVST